MQRLFTLPGIFMLLYAASGCETALPPPPPPPDLAPPADLAGVAQAGDLARYMGDGGVTKCGALSCQSHEVCVVPGCCPRCIFVAMDACPKGTTWGRCPVGGAMACVEPCTPPPPRCDPVPANCRLGRTCDCLDARVSCGAYGGMCASNLGGDGYALFCAGCF